jgi:hypothetical protein
VRLGGSRRRLAVVGGLLVVAAVASSSAATAEQRAAAVTVKLQSPDATKCKGAGGEVVGKACADKRGMILATKWQTGDGNASWTTDQWQTTYAWTVPSTIPLGGANATIRMTAVEKLGGPNNRICPAMSIRGGFDMKVGGASQGQPVGLGFCAQAGGSESDQKTIKVVPSSATAAGQVLVLQIGIQDGPGYTYTYKAVSTGPKCRKPSAVGRSSDCKYRLNWIATQGGRRPKGMPAWVTDVATVGTGSVVYTEGDDGNDVKTATARVVRTMEIARNDPDTGVTVDEVKLVFRASKPPRVRVGATKTLFMDLDLIASTDPFCPDEVGGKPREASIFVAESSRVYDVLTLHVVRCAHHNATFKGSKGPNSAVKVAIERKPA